MSHSELVKKIKPMPGIDTKPILSAGDHYVTGVTTKGHYRRMYRVGLRGYTTAYAYRKEAAEGSWITIELDWSKSAESAVASWNRFVSLIEKACAAGRGEG
jgi:hypothetical protein